MKLGAAHTAGDERVPDAQQRPLRCCAEPGPRSHTVHVERWAPALQRTTPHRTMLRIAGGPLRCVRGTRIGLIDKHAFAFSRRAPPELCCRFAPIEKKGRREGRAPAGTQGPHATRRTRGWPQVIPGSRPSLRNGVTAYCVLSPGSDALLPPSPCGPRMRARSAAASPQALTPACGRQDHTLLPSADVPPRTAGSSRVLAPDAEKKRCDRAVSCRGSWRLTGLARPAIPSRAGAAASIASRPTYRDDRETPLWRAGMECGL